MSEQLLGIARLAFLLANERSSSTVLADALDLIASTGRADFIGLIEVPEQHERPFGLDALRDAPTVGDTPDNWRTQLEAAAPVWTEIRAQSSVQLQLSSDAFGADIEALLAEGYQRAGFFPLKVDGVMGAMVACRRDGAEWDRDEFLFLRIAAGELATHLEIGELERRKHDEARRCHELLDEVDGAVLRTDPAGRVRLANARANRLFDQEVEAIVGTPIFDLFEESRRPLVESQVRMALEGAIDDFRMYSHVTRGNEPLDVEIVARVTELPDGNRELVGAVFDATHQLRSVDLLAREMKRESLGVMAGGIAHDFNNLLQSMLTSADILADRLPPDDEDYEFIELIRTSGKRMGELTGQLRAFARGGNPRPRPTSVAEIMKQVLDAPRFQGESRVRVSVMLAKSLARVEADPNQLFQVFYNIAANAFEAIEASRGNLKIIGRNVELTEGHRVLTNQKVAPGAYVEVTFADTGRGISRDDIKRIFDPFFTTKSLGAGLGLAAAYGIIQAHGGALDVESTVGEGTTIRVYLPSLPD